MGKSAQQNAVSDSERVSATVSSSVSTRPHLSFREIGIPFRVSRVSTAVSRFRENNFWNWRNTLSVLKTYSFTSVKSFHMWRLLSSTTVSSHLTRNNIFCSAAKSARVCNPQRMDNLADLDDEEFSTPDWRKHFADNRPLSKCRANVRSVEAYHSTHGDGLRVLRSLTRDNCCYWEWQLHGERYHQRLLDCFLFMQFTSIDQTTRTSVLCTWISAGVRDRHYFFPLDSCEKMVSCHINPEIIQSAAF